LAAIRSTQLAWEHAAMARGGGWSMTIGGSIALIIIGAILKWGISWKPAHLDLGSSASS